MEKLSDYSGELLPELDPEDFSSETLRDLLMLYSKMYMGVDGFWYLTVMEKFGSDAALDCDIKVWEKASRYEMKNVTKQLNIQGNDAVAFMKALQLSPWYWTVKTQIEIVDPNTAILTVTDCPTLNALEKEGSGRENEICKIAEPIILKAYASFFNPDVEVTCLQSPPRKSQDDIACKWQFKM